jgi:hypothetical protein
MTYWLSSVTHERFLADQEYEFAVDGYQESEFNRALRVGPGDRFVYYIKGLELFAALAEARGRCYLDWTRLWPDGSYPVRFERRPLLVLSRAQMVAARPLISRLSLAQERSGDSFSLSQLLRFDLREIPRADYELIEREMRHLGEGV